MIKQLNPNKNSESTQKLTAEELEEFKKIHGEVSQCIVDLGWLEINFVSIKEQLELLENNKTQLLDKIKDLNVRKQDLSNKLGDKYGDKQVDLETGELN
jgi:hypothetical protein